MSNAIGSVMLILLLAAGVSGCRNDVRAASGAPLEGSLLNVSYDPTRELYAEINREFARAWSQTAGQTLSVKQSHGGSGKQARAVIDGLEADIVTLALGYDIDVMHERAALLPQDWRARLPHDSVPYSSTVVLVVRAGNPKQIHGFDDLARGDVSVITPNPKTSGGARWNYLALWGHALSAHGGDEVKAREFVGRVFGSVPVLDSGARAATTTFMERGIGDVLIAWESEALLTLRRIGRDDFEIVMPARSIVAETPVALVDKYADKHGTRRLAEAYLNFLYSPEGQRIAAKHHFRPRDPRAMGEHAAQFGEVQGFTVDELCGSWAKAQQVHFADGAIFDQLYRPGK